MTTYTQTHQLCQQIMTTIDRVDAKLERYKAQSRSRKTRLLAPKKQTFVSKKNQALNEVISGLEAVLDDVNKTELTTESVNNKLYSLHDILYLLEFHSADPQIKKIEEFTRKAIKSLEDYVSSSCI